METEFGAVVRVIRWAVIGSVAAAVLVACSGGIHGTVVSQGGAVVYQQPPHRGTGGGVAPGAVQVGRLSYQDAVVVVCYLPADRAFKISVAGRAGYIEDGVALVNSDGTPIHPSNVNDC